MLVGIAEGFHNPTKSRTLFARWVVGDAPVASSGVATLFRFNYTINLEEAEMLCVDGMSAIFLAVDDSDGSEVFDYEGDLLLTDQRVCTGTVEIDLQAAIDPLLAGYPFQFMFGLGDMCPDIVNISSPLGIWEQVPFYGGFGAFYSYSGVLQAGTNEISVVGSMPEYGTVCGGIIE